MLLPLLKLASRRLCSTLLKEWKNLIELKKQSLIRKIAVHEEDKEKIADIFERINRAREQLIVRICVIVVHFSYFIAHPIHSLGGDRSQSSQDCNCNSGGCRGV